MRVRVPLCTSVRAVALLARASPQRAYRSALLAERACVRVLSGPRASWPAPPALATAQARWLHNSPCGAGRIPGAAPPVDHAAPSRVGAAARVPLTQLQTLYAQKRLREVVAFVVRESDAMRGALPFAVWRAAMRTLGSAGRRDDAEALWRAACAQAARWAGAHADGGAQPPESLSATSLRNLLADTMDALLPHSSSNNSSNSIVGAAASASSASSSGGAGEPRRVVESHVARAMSLVDEFCRARALPPTGRMLEVLFVSVLDAGLPDALLVESVERLSALGLVWERVTVTLRTLVEHVGKTHAQFDRMDAWAARFERALGRPCNLVMSGIFASLYRHSQWERLDRAVEQCWRDGHEWTPDMYQRVLAALFQQGRVEDGESFLRRLDVAVRHTSWVYNFVVKAYAERGEWARAADWCSRALRDRRGSLGPGDAGIVANVALDQLARNAQWQLVENLLAEMASASASASASSASATASSAPSSDVRPNWEMLVLWATHHVQFERAMQYAARARASSAGAGGGRGAVTRKMYDALLLCALRAEQFAAVPALVSDMRDVDGVPLAREHHQELLHALSVLQRWPEVEHALDALDADARADATVALAPAELVGFGARALDAGDVGVAERVLRMLPAGTSAGLVRRLADAYRLLGAADKCEALMQRERSSSGSSSSSRTAHVYNAVLGASVAERALTAQRARVLGHDAPGGWRARVARVLDAMRDDGVAPDADTTAVVARACVDDSVARELAARVASEPLWARAAPALCAALAAVPGGAAALDAVLRAGVSPEAVREPADGDRFLADICTCAGALDETRAADALRWARRVTSADCAPLSAARVRAALQLVLRRIDEGGADAERRAALLGAERLVAMAADEAGFAEPPLDARVRRALVEALRARVDRISGGGPGL